MTQLCCMSLTLSVKLIGTFGLSLSILMINMLVSNFFSTKEEEDFVLAIESWMFFGLNWTYVMRSLQVVETARTMLACVIIYALFSLVANALLALGSLLKKPNYLAPWMFMQMISVIDQTIAVLLQLIHSDNPKDNSNWTIFYIPACCTYLVISSYFWMVVSAARKEWLLREEAYDPFSPSSSPRGLLPDANLPKTPSFLSSNITISFDTPPYIAPPKYEIV